MNRTVEIKELCEGMGWIEILPQKNPVMISFRPEENDRIRMNIYFTRMTVTIQSKDKPMGFCETYKDVTMEKLESILHEARS